MEKKILTGLFINKGMKIRHGNNEICSKVTDVAVRISPSQPPTLLLASLESNAN